VFDLAPGVDRAGLIDLPVLVFDDTTTTGAAVQSAAAALRLAGAQVVGALVMGRALAPAARVDGASGPAWGGR
jgi:orotate phosphoribosyltransferase